MKDQEEQFTRMGEDLKLHHIPYNLSTNSSALRCVYLKSILGSL